MAHEVDYIKCICGERHNSYWYDDEVPFVCRNMGCQATVMRTMKDGELQTLVWPKVK